MKETKEIMKILSENKKKEQEKDRQLKVTKEKAKDVAGCVWMSIAYLLIMFLISRI